MSRVRADKDIDASASTRAFLVGCALFYVVLSLGMMVALDRSWSANWDAVTYIESARTFWDGGSLFDLYETSRATRYWPYVYMPLYAMVLAPFIWLSDLVTGGPATALPQLIAVRAPILAADVGIALLLHRILSRTSTETWLPRLGVALWLFNPILFYHTAVQAHFETLWLFPILAAYTWLEERGLERVWAPQLLLVLAMAVKQSAVLFALPLGLFLLWQRRWKAVGQFALLFVLLVGGPSLPFYLYSDDFRYLVVDYVSQMPVQVQSWQLWALGLEQFRLEQTVTTFPTVRYAMVLALGASALLAIWAVAKRHSWYVIGAGVALVYFLTAHKAMAYHYPILLLWVLTSTLHTQRLGLAGATLLWTSWVVVSPYFAPWAEANHLPFYAALGTLNSLFYAWLLYQIMTSKERPSEEREESSRHKAILLTRWATLLALAFVLATLVHPLRVLLPNTLSVAAALLILVLAAVLVGLAPLASWAARALALPDAVLRRAPFHLASLALAIFFVPLFFTWFTMNAEITAVIEKGVVEAWGVEERLGERGAGRPGSGERGAERRVGA
ncbi:MAG: glycosyltransferase 87 family protein [Chloroflexota bacterium]|nr:glycosyltransferase 87 family protein [Chloroflexota bacterium]